MTNSFLRGYATQLEEAITPPYSLLIQATISGRATIVSIEHYRAVAGGPASLEQGVPVDVFSLGRGEASARHLTKVNGFTVPPQE